MPGNFLTGKGLEAQSVDFNKLSSQAVTDIKASRLTALRSGVFAFVFPASDSDDVSTEVLAAAITDTPRLNLLDKGIYVGPLSGSTDIKRVLIMEAGTTDPFPDGLGGDVFGILTEALGVYTLTLKKSNNTNHSFIAPTNIDFFFIEIYGEDNRPTDAHLLSGVGGGGGGVPPLKEIPAGVIDGVNDTFVLSFPPAADDAVLIFVDSLFVTSSKWSLNNGDEIVFNAGSIPQLGQDIEVYYVPLVSPPPPPPGSDLTNIEVNIQPDIDGSRSIGTAAKRWKEIFLRDQTTGDTYRLEVDNGVFQVVLVP